jgi:hypothetical protein
MLRKKERRSLLDVTWHDISQHARSSDPLPFSPFSLTLVTTTIFSTVDNYPVPRPTSSATLRLTVVDASLLAQPASHEQSRTDDDRRARLEEVLVLEAFVCG